MLRSVCGVVWCAVSTTDGLQAGRSEAVRDDETRSSLRKALSTTGRRPLMPVKCVPMGHEKDGARKSSRGAGLPIRLRFG